MNKKENVKVMLLNCKSNILKMENPYVRIYDMENPLKIDNVTDEDVIFLVYDKNEKLLYDFDILEFKKKTLTIGIIINWDDQEDFDRITSLIDCYVMVNEEDINNLSGIIEAFADAVFPDGLINLDLDDVKSILENSGKVGIEVASSKLKNRLDVANQIIEKMGENISKIDKMIIHFSADKGLTLFEMEDIMDVFKEKIQKDANIIYGSSITDEEEKYTKVTIIANFNEDINLDN